MSIKCGSCKLSHESAAEVKRCYGVGTKHAERVNTQPAESHDTARAHRTEANARLTRVHGGSVVLARLREQAKANRAAHDLKTPEDVAEIQRRERADDERAYASKPTFVPDPDVPTFDFRGEEGGRNYARMCLEIMKTWEPYGVMAKFDQSWGQMNRWLTSNNNSGRRLDAAVLYDWDAALAEDSSQQSEKLPEWIRKQEPRAAEAHDARASEIRDEKRRNDRTPVTEDGMYRNPWDGTIYKVQKAVHGSGHLYAKKLEVIGTPEDGDAEGTFVYAPGAFKLLRASWKMTLDEAKEFGALYGVCCRCGRTLTDEGSIADGIGPVCAGKEDWAA